MLSYYMCYFEDEIDDAYCVCVSDELDVSKLLKIFPHAQLINEHKAFYYGWTLPLKEASWVGGFASTRHYVELKKSNKQAIIREAIHATYLTILQSRYGRKSWIDKVASVPIDLFV